MAAKPEDRNTQCCIVSIFLIPGFFKLFSGTTLLHKPAPMLYVYKMCITDDNYSHYVNIRTALFRISRFIVSYP